MSVLDDARDEIIAVCEKHGVKLEVMGPGAEEYEEWIEVVYRGYDDRLSTRLYK